MSDDLTWHNRATPNDVNNSGTVDAEDALLILDELDAHRIRVGDTGLLIELDGIPAMFCDPSNDGYVVPFDALLIINQLNDIAISDNILTVTNQRTLAAHAIPEPAASLLMLAALPLFCAVRSAHTRRLIS